MLRPPTSVTSISAIFLSFNSLKSKVTMSPWWKLRNIRSFENPLIRISLLNTRITSLPKSEQEQINNRKPKSRGRIRFIKLFFFTGHCRTSANLRIKSYLSPYFLSLPQKTITNSNIDIYSKTYISIELFKNLIPFTLFIWEMVIVKK